MTVRVTLDIAGRRIDETIAGKDADDVLVQAKDRVAGELGWKGLFLRALTPLGFAQEAVKRYNSAFHTNHPLPQSADEFLALGQTLGYVTLLP